MTQRGPAHGSMSASPNPPRQALIAFVMLPLALAAGFTLGWREPFVCGEVGGRSVAPSGSNSLPGSHSGISAGFAAERVWIERIRASGVAEFPSLWHDIRAIPDKNRRRSIFHTLYAKWVPLDPAGCLSYAWEQDRYEAYPALDLFLQLDPDAAYGWARAGGMAQTRQFFFQLKEINPVKFLEFAAAAGPEDHSDHELQQACRLLGKIDPVTAMESVEKLPSKLRRHASWGLGEGWASRDPASALDWARQVADPAGRQSALRGVIHALALSDPQAAIAHLNLLEDITGTEGAHPAKAIVQSLLKLDPRQALNFALSGITDSKLREEVVFDSILPELTGLLLPTDLADILDKAQLIRPGEFSWSTGSNSDSPFTRYTISAGFAAPRGKNTAFKLLPEKGDPAPIFRDLVSQATTPASKYLASAMATQWVRQDAPAAVAEYHASSGGRRETLAFALVEHAANSKDLPLIATLEADLPKKASNLLHHILSGSGQLDPQVALDQAATFPPEGEVRAHVTRKALESWLNYDVEGVLSYAQARPAHERDTFYRWISQTWASLDAYANSEWVSSLPQGTNRDHAAAALAEQLTFVEPSSAVAWAGSIQNPDLRRMTLLITFGKWGGSDAPAARQALETLDPPLPLKAELSNIITHKSSLK